MQCGIFEPTGAKPPLNRQRSCSPCWPGASLMDMTGVGTQFDSLRFSGFESRRLAMALALSLAAHLLVWGGYEFGKTFNLWQRLHLPPLTLFAKIKPAQPVAQPSEPIVFVDVSPAQATTEAPKNAKYFGVHNSIAANPEMDRNKEMPQINGRQTDVPKVEDTRRTAQLGRSEVQPLPQTSPSLPKKTQMQLAMNAGDLTLGKPLEAQPAEQIQPRPRTLKQALAQQSQLPGQKMKQDGGVHRHAIAPSLTVKVTGFSEYDRRFIEMVDQRWWNLLASQMFTMDRTGKVVLLFRLNYDGSITDMKIAENTVGDLLGYVCEKAVLDNVPFQPWPTNMRLELGDYCDVQFTFYYSSY